MDQRRVALTRFDFDAFTAAILAFLRTQGFEEVDPSYAIVTVAHPGDVPEYGPPEGRDTFAEELAAGRWLFYPFSTSNIGAGVACADGRQRLLPDDEEEVADRDREGSVDGAPACPAGAADSGLTAAEGAEAGTHAREASGSDEGGPYLGEIDCVGFLVGRQDGYYVIDSAIHAGGACPGPAPSVDAVPCGVFDAAMAAYVDRFVVR
jgi:hypothetical protein